MFQKKPPYTLFLAMLIFSNSLTFSQSVWNSNSFKFSRDNAPLENMTGATVISFGGGGVQASGSIPFGSFSFRYGLSSFSNFYVSSYGFIKLGSPITSNIPAQDSIIAPLYNGTSWSALYKSAGSSPDRKMVIQFSGVMQPSGEPTNFQVWFYERTGKIQFVYQQIRGFYGYSTSYNYKIYCGARIMNKSTIAAVKVNSNNVLPAVNYASIPTSFDSIYANTRFTFQPDTLKPAIPASLAFSNIQPGCLSVDITENSANESLVSLERSDNGTLFSTEKLYYVTSPAGSTTYNYAQTFVQPFWNYTYRTYVSNGFLNSDTLTNTVQTLMPQINGVKRVPGDYPTIKALLQDAACKHLGPNLVIELQSNYDFATEPKPVSFGSILQNRLIQSIVIRPALNATINWDAFTSRALFYVDSVKHVFIDGRPGGIGTSQNFTISQQNPQAAVIQYTNQADSGGIKFCKIIKASTPILYSTYAVIIVPKDSAFSFPKKNVNAFSLINNSITSDNNGFISNLVFINPADSTGCKNFVISGNQFSRFKRSAIHFEKGGENLLISNNRFFQPVGFQSDAPIPGFASCISLLDVEKATIDNNFFGGGSATWGTGKFSVTINSSDFCFINCQNTSTGNKVFITNNKFGNIEFIGNTYNGSKLIDVFKGDVFLDNNQFGTTDSINSITSPEYFWGVHIVFGNGTVSNNRFSGFQGGYLTSPVANASYFLTSFLSDSIAILNNDIGGSDDAFASSSSGAMYGMWLGGDEKNLTIKNNIIRGFTSRNRSTTGISSGIGSQSSIALLKLEVDSNSIHHLQGSTKITAIAFNANSRATNRIANNHIYALKATGTTLDPNGGGYLSSSYGINYSMYNWGYPAAEFKGDVEVFGNKIHSFESIRTLPGSVFSQYGIYVTSIANKAYNNEIRFGIDSRGQQIDSLTSLNGIVIIPAGNQPQVANNHFVEHNSIYFGGKGRIGSVMDIENYSTYGAARNVTVITNNIFNIDRIPLSGNPMSYTMFENLNGMKTIGAKNIWYSAVVSNTATLLQSFKNACRCDSSSFVGNPLFINPTGDSSNYNLRPGTGSLADSAGTPSVVSIPKDLDNKTRNAFSPVDIGAYAATPCGTGIFPQITLSPAGDSLQLCSGGTITLTASITGGSFQQLQWQINLVDSIGANTASLVLNHPGAYRLVGKTACGQVASKMVYVVSTVLQKSVTISTPADTICLGATAVFTAVTVNCGSNPVYQWKVNGVNAGTNNSIFSSNSLNNNDSIKVIVTTTVCGNNSTVTSNTIGIKVRPYTPPAIAITADNTTICSSGPVAVNFAATVTNIGNNPVYQWQVNGVNVGTNSSTFTSSSLNNNDQVRCILTSDPACASQVIVNSNIITMTVPSGTVIPMVAISAPTTTICLGDNITFTATPTYGGSAPFYQWKVNGLNVGTNSNTFNTNTLTNGSVVQVVLASSLSCASPTTAASNSLTITIGSNIIPSVTIAASSSIICPGTTVIFNATSINGGPTPVYQWKKNGVNVGTNNPTYSSNTLVHGDVIAVQLNSNAPCASTATVSSNNITMSVSTITPTITISGNTTVVVGTTTVISSTITNAGNSYAYQWQDSTATHTWQNISGSNVSSLNFYAPLATGDKLRCLLTGVPNCTTGGNFVVSNTLTFTINPPGGRLRGYVRYYPNPVRDIITLDSLNLRDNWETVSIINTAGAKTGIIENISGLTRATINVEALPAGLYIAVLNSRFDGMIFFKFVKQ